MMKTPRNQRTITVKMKRLELCDLLVALSVVTENGASDKYKRLHDELIKQLDEFDEKLDNEQ